MNAPMPEHPVEITIQRVVSGGLGMAFHDGMTVFVPHAAPGDRLRVVGRHLRGRTLSADILEILDPGPDRCAPFCSHYTRCGGCQMQHLTPDGALRIKGELVADALRHVGKLSGVTVHPTRSPPRRTGYRQRASLKARQVDGRLLLGFFEPNSRHLVDLPGCPVLHPTLEALMDPLRACLGALTIADALPQVEVTCGDEGVGMLLHVLRPPASRDEDALRVFAREAGLQQLGLRRGDHTQRLWREGEITYHGEGVVLAYQPGDFTQNNMEMNRLLMGEVLGRAGRGRAALDLFCGLGNFTLPLAQLFSEVTGMEVNAGALRQGEENARRNGLANVTFRRGDLFSAQEVDKVPLKGVESVVLDPPREGAVALAKRLARDRVPRLVYVSCNPATLARDAAILVHGGYAMGPVQPLEMFPHTHHVESVVLFEGTP